MHLLRLLLFVLLLASGAHGVAAGARKPNILYILADDLGYGDVRCLNRDGKIATPHLDRLAAAGMIFTDAHSSSAVCTPTRYGLLTGRYNWRSRLKSGVMGGMSPPLLEAGRLTVPAFLKLQGFHTACIGKWHLGLDWPRRPDTAPFTDGIEKGADGWRVDFAKPIVNGPNAFGFDFFFGEALVHHSINGSFALRQGRWKLALCADSGGWSPPRPDSPEAKTLAAPQLYDLSSDAGEAHNVATAHPDVVLRLTKLLEKIVADGRSTPGAPQPNTTPVNLR